MTRKQVASQGGKARARALSAKRRREIAASGARALNQSRTAEERREAARGAVTKRWKAQRARNRKLKRGAA